MVVIGGDQCKGFLKENVYSGFWRDHVSFFGYEDKTTD